jgi:WD40 repeat protein
LLASSGWDNTIRLWKPATGTCVQVIRDLDHPDTFFLGVAWGPDGKFLASGTLQQGVLLWEVRTGAERWIGRELPILIRWVAWSPDGARLASGGGSRGEGELFVWDAQTWTRLYHLHGPSEVVYALAWIPDGAGLVSGGSDGRLCWWDLRHGERVLVRKVHEGTVQALRVSPDGKRLASCGDDGAIRLWDLNSGELLRTMRRDRPYERLTFTGIRGLTKAEIATLQALGAVEGSVQ